MARKKRRGQLRHRIDFCSYVITIDGWSANSGIWVFEKRLRLSSPLSEGYSLDVAGRFLTPDRLRGQSVAVDVQGCRTLSYLMEHPEKVRQDLERIGDLHSRAGKSSLWFRLPHEHLPLVVQCLACGHFKYVVATGGTLYRCHAFLKNVYFTDHLDPEDYADIEDLPETSLDE